MRFITEWLLPFVIICVLVISPMIYLDGYYKGKSLKRQVCAGDRSELSAQRSMRFAQVDLVYRGALNGYDTECSEVL